MKGGDGGGGGGDKLPESQWLCTKIDSNKNTRKRIIKCQIYIKLEEG